MAEFNGRKFSTYLSAAAGCAAAASILKIISVKITFVLGAAFVLYSLPTIYFSFEKGKRAQIISSVFSFFAGIILLLISWYEIINPVKVVFPSLLFICGMILLFLYAENKKEIMFLYAGAAAAAVGLAVALLYRHIPFIYQAERIVFTLSDYWYILAAGTGLFILFNRKNS